jgi:O-antigen/teichoic acid export membrane protein
MVVLTMLGHMTFHDAVATYVASANTSTAKSQYVTHGGVMVVLISTLLATGFYILVMHGGMWAGTVKESLATVVLILPLECLSIIIMSLLNASGRFRTMTLFSIVAGAVPLVIIAPSTALWGIDGWVVARLVSCSVVFCVGLFLIREYLSIWGVDIQKALELIRFARIQVVSGALSTAMLSGDVIMLERLTQDSREIGHYGLAALFSRSLAFVPATLGRLYFKDIASGACDDGRRWHSISRLLILTLGVSCVLALLVFMCGGPILRTLYGAEYQDSIRVLKVLSLGIIFSGLWSALSTTNIALKKPFFSVMTSTVGVVIAAVLFVTLVPSTGAVGTAWSINAAYLCGCGAGLALLWNKWRQSNKPNSVSRVA